MSENGFWRVCEALDSELRIRLLLYLLSVETSEFPCVNELADRFRITSATMSVHLRKLSLAGLVASKRADRRVYYRAFATSDEGALVIDALRGLSATHPSEDRLRMLLEYAHVLSHHRRNALVRCLQAEPGLSLKDLALRTEMPPQTADRLIGQLNWAHIVDSNGVICTPTTEPEATLLKLTLAPSLLTFS